MVKELTTENFDSRVLKSDRPSVVMVYSAFCTQCEKQAPIFEEAADASDHNFFRFDGQQYFPLAKRYKVAVVPTLLFFAHGKLVERLRGVTERERIEAVLDKIAGYSEKDAARKEVRSWFRWPRLFSKQ